MEDTLSLEQARASVLNWLQGYPADVPVVVVPVYNAYEDSLNCLESLLANSPLATPVLVLDDASPDERFSRELAGRGGFCYVRKPANRGFVDSANLAFEWCRPHDVVLVNSDVIVPPGWLERLQTAAYFRTNIASATPLTNHGSILSLPERNRPGSELPPGLSLEQVDQAVRQASGQLRPLIPTAIGHCTYFKRSALEAVGYFDPVFSPGYAEEVDFSLRAGLAGFSHVAVDDLFVYHKGSGSFGLSEARRRLQSSHEEIIERRYPWYGGWVEEAAHSEYTPLALALQRARAALSGWNIAIDASALDGKTAGTQVVTLELIAALVQLQPEFGPLSLILRDGVELEVLAGLDRQVAQVLRVSELSENQFDLIHRPAQIWHESELIWLQKATRRLVVTFLDAIFFANPGYADSPSQWQAYRELTRLVFSQADGIIFSSQEAALDCAQQGLRMPIERAAVTYIGVDHRLHRAGPHPVELPDRPFLLVLGNNFKHKNRLYALRLFYRLVEDFGWEGQLVLAGAQLPQGGSTAEEQAVRQGYPALDRRIHDLGAVDESQKRWLLEQAALLLYPSYYEGFGIVPFEAAALGTPALTFATTSLHEVLGAEPLYLNQADLAKSAQTAWQLLSEPTVAHRQVEAIRARAARYNWPQVAADTLSFYRQVLEQPPRLAQPPRQQVLAELRQQYGQLEKWSHQLANRLQALDRRPLYRLLSRLKLL